MKNLTKSLIVASALVASSAMADEDVLAGEGGVQIKGHIPVKCTLDIAEGATLDLGHNPVIDQHAYLSEEFTFKCNAKQGANISMTSTNTGLVCPDQPGYSVDYGAWLQFIGFEKDTMGGIGGDYLELETEDGPTSNTLMSGQLDTMLAMGMVTGKLSVAVRDAMKFAGYYNDTLTVNISAKI